VAALFAVHRLTWSRSRGSRAEELWSTLFFILAIAAYAWYAQKPDWRDISWSQPCCCGIDGQADVITLPFVLMLLD